MERPAWAKKMMQDQITILKRPMNVRGPVSRSTGAGTDGVVQPMMPIGKFDVYNKKNELEGQAILDEGEEVVDAQTVKELGGNTKVKQIIEQARTGRIPRFYKGGTVKPIKRYAVGGTIDPNESLTNLISGGTSSLSQAIKPITAAEKMGMKPATQTPGQLGITPQEQMGYKPATQTPEQLGIRPISTNPLGMKPATQTPEQLGIKPITVAEKMGYKPATQTPGQLGIPTKPIAQPSGTYGYKPATQTPTQIGIPTPTAPITPSTTPQTPMDYQQQALGEQWAITNMNSPIYKKIANLYYGQLDPRLQTQMTITAMNIANNPNMTEGAKRTAMAEQLRNAGIAQADLAGQLATKAIDMATGALEQVPGIAQDIQDENWKQFEVAAQWGSDADILAAYKLATGKDLDPASVAEIKNYYKTKRAQELTVGEQGITQNDININKLKTSLGVDNYDAIAKAVDQGISLESINSTYGTNLTQADYDNIAADRTNRLTQAEQQIAQNDITIKRLRNTFGDEEFDSAAMMIGNGATLVQVQARFPNIQQSDYDSIRSASPLGEQEYSRAKEKISSLLAVGGTDNITAAGQLMSDLYGTTVNVDQLVSSNNTGTFNTAMNNYLVGKEQGVDITEPSQQNYLKEMFKAQGGNPDDASAFLEWSTKFDKKLTDQGKVINQVTYGWDDTDWNTYFGDVNTFEWTNPAGGAKLTGKAGAKAFLENFIVFGGVSPDGEFDYDQWSDMMEGQLSQVSTNFPDVIVPTETSFTPKTINDSSYGKILTENGTNYVVVNKDGKKTVTAMGYDTTTTKENRIGLNVNNELNVSVSGTQDWNSVSGGQTVRFANDLLSVTYGTVNTAGKILAGTYNVISNPISGSSATDALQSTDGKTLYVVNKNGTVSKYTKSITGTWVIVS